MTGYNHDALVSGGNDGTGQLIGFVEFSNYNQADPIHFKNCFTGITAGLGADATIGGGPSDHFGQVEVNLDIEVAMGAAPDAGLKVYKAAEQPGAAADDARTRCAPTASTSSRTAGASASCSFRSS